MSGAIVVEDPEGSLPRELEAMREVVMVLQETNIESGEVLGRRGDVPLFCLWRSDTRRSRNWERLCCCFETLLRGRGIIFVVVCLSHRLICSSICVFRIAVLKRGLETSVRYAFCTLLDFKCARRGGMLFKE